MVSVNLAVVSGKRIVHAENLNPDSDSPVNIVAVKGARYLLMQGDDLIGPQLIKVNRAGKDLWLMLQGKDKPQLVIKHFYDQPGEIIGLGEDQQWHSYLSANADADFNPGALQDGAESALLLGQASVKPLENLEVDTGSSNTLLYALSGMGAAAAIAALVLMTQHGRGESKHLDISSEQDDSSFAQAIIPSPQLYDDVGDHQGILESGETTDDTQPILSGSGQLEGSVVQLLDNGKSLGSALVDAQGNWSFIPEPPLTNGNHEFIAVVTAPDGSSSAPSEPTQIIVESSPESQELGLESLLPAGSDLTDWAAMSWSELPELPTHTGSSPDDNQPFLDDLLISNHHIS
ncbi:Ig-like domain-containing protein [Pantoea agglomerans]